MSVVVEIRPNGCQSESIRSVTNTALLRYIRECAVAVVVVEVGRGALQPTRAALHVDSAILARLAGTERRKIVQMKIHVMRDKQVDPTIAVVVAKGRARCPL